MREKIASAMGERHILPRQTKVTAIISVTEFELLPGGVVGLVVVHVVYYGVHIVVIFVEMTALLGYEFALISRLHKNFHAVVIAVYIVNYYALVVAV